MDQGVQDWLDALQVGQADIARRFVEIVAATAPDLDVALKWGKPTFALDGDFHHWICQIGATERGVGLTFHFGSLLDDRSGVFVAGTSPYLRKIEAASENDLDAKIVADLVSQAALTLDRFKASRAPR
jgi:hypothetical protein